MDLFTQYYYSNNAERITKKQAANRGGISAWFAGSFPEGSRILDVGAGSGVNLACLLDSQYEVYGVEPCQAFISGAEAMFPQVQGRIAEDSLPGLQAIPDGQEDAVLCSDVLMHLPEEELFEAFFNLRRVLRPGGRMLISLPLDDEGKPFRGRDARGLIYNGLSSLRLELFLARLGFNCTRRGEIRDDCERNQKNLDVRLFVLEKSRPDKRLLDRISAFLGEGGEVTTYRVALIRALAEIGMTQYHRIHCLPDNTVSLPVEVVAEKWFEYYWPLVDSKTLIPQVRQTAPSTIRKLSFRQVLSELVGLFRTRGGLDAFLLRHRSHSFSPDEFALFKKAMVRLCNTIRLGTVLCAQGGDSGDALFRYDGKTKSLIMDRDLWLEFCLRGSRIRDAALLRWGGLIEQFSEGRVASAEALRLLIHPPRPERQVSDVQRLSLEKGEPTCVWTGEPLQAGDLEVTRAIPFSLWRNNDLWNLFPSKRGLLGNSRRNQLPTLRLIQARKRGILETWDRAFTAYPERFRSETAFLAGTYITHQRNWPHRLFSLLGEAVEFTASQLQVPRWEP